MTNLLGTVALAAAAAARFAGDLERSATLVGAVDALLNQRVELGFIWTPRERAMYDDLVSDLSEALGDDYATCLRRGAELSSDGVLDLVAGRR